MLNGHPPENPYFPSSQAEFATKTDVYVLENKVQWVVKEQGGMATAIEKLGETLTKVKINVDSLVVKKGINDGLKACAYKCFMVFGGSIGTLLTLHAVGIIKILDNLVRWMIS